MSDGLLSQPGVLGFQFPNAGLQRLDLRGNILRRKLLWNVLTAVDVPNLDLDENRALGVSGVRWIAQATKEGRVAFDHRGMAPQLDAGAPLIIDEKQTHGGIFR